MFLFNIWKLSQTQSYIVIGLAAVAFLCLIGIIVLSVKSKNATKNEIVNENKPVEDIQIAEEKEVNNVENQNLDNETEALKQATDEANKDNTDSDSTDVSEASILNQTNNVENVESDEANDISADSLEQKNEENNEGIEENSQNQDDTPDLSNIKTITKTNSFIKVSYLKSYRAKVSMALDTVRDYYRIIKEHCLKYGLKSRMSWGCETIYKGRIPYAKLTIRGKNLNVNLALNPNDFENTKYYFKDTRDSKKYEMVPMRVKVKSSRSLKYALELIDIMMANNNFKKNEAYETINTAEPIRSFDANLALGLIKKVKGRKASLEEIVENRISDEVEGDSYQDDYPDDMDELVIDSEILEMVWEIVGTHPKKGKKSIINLDDINAAYEDNEIVSKDSLKEKKLISSNIGQVKCLARGRLSKALIFQLEDYSLQAIEKILLSGGEIR